MVTILQNTFWQYAMIGSDNGMTPNRRQSLTWTKDGIAIRGKSVTRPRWAKNEILLIFSCIAVLCISNRLQNVGHRFMYGCMLASKSVLTAVKVGPSEASQTGLSSVMESVIYRVPSTLNKLAARQKTKMKPLIPLQVTLWHKISFQVYLPHKVHSL